MAKLVLEFEIRCPKVNTFSFLQFFYTDLLGGQLITKCLFGIFNSPKKRTKQFNYTTMVPQVDLFSFVFWENSRHQKDILKLTDL